MNRTLSLLLALPAVGLVTYACGGANNTGVLPDGGAGAGSTGSGSGGEGSGTGGTGTGEAGSSGTGGAGNVPVSCQSDKACAATEQVCDVARAVCVDCLIDTDCGDAAECKLGECKAFTPCESSKQCGDDEVCDTVLGRCVQCVGANDCPDGNLCVDSECRASCGSDKDCSAQDQVCDTLNGFCVGCLTNEDCDESQYCEQTAHACASDICTPDSTQCSDDTLMTCNVDGTGFDQLACPEGCVTDDGPAHCADIIAPTCEGATADPCTSIPKFTGTQVVDGDPDEFCDVPYRIMTPQNAGLFAGPTGAITTPSGTETSQAIVRVAWSPGYLHLHVRVVDPALVTMTNPYEYDGDNVQLFVSPVVPSSGETMTPNYCATVYSAANQLFMVPGDNSTASRFVCTSWAPSTGYTYLSKLTNDGYEVEAQVPWAGGVTQAAGANVGFDLMVGVNNSSIREYEYGLYIEAGSSASCGSAKSLWCDAGLWCTPKLAP